MHGTRAQVHSTFVITAIDIWTENFQKYIPECLQLMRKGTVIGRTRRKNAEFIDKPTEILDIFTV